MHENDEFTFRNTLGKIGVQCIGLFLRTCWFVCLVEKKFDTYTFVMISKNNKRPKKIICISSDPLSFDSVIMLEWDFLLTLPLPIV